MYSDLPLIGKHNKFSGQTGIGWGRVKDQVGREIDRVEGESARKDRWNSFFLKVLRNPSIVQTSWNI